MILLLTIHTLLNPPRELKTLRGKKKLSFVMALMNRSHQIEKTLIKNLEDNWEDL